jgi:type VI secretion system protein ImpB
MPESTQHKLDRVRRPRVQITYDVETLGSIVKTELPFVVGIMADLSGNAIPTPATTNPTLLKDRKFVEIDRDNFDTIMEKIKPTVTVKSGGESNDLKFTKLEDFDPINVLRQVPLLSRSFDSRTRLSNLVAKLDGNIELQKQFVKEFNELKNDVTTRGALDKYYDALYPDKLKPVAWVPTVTNATAKNGTTNASGLVITRNAADDTEVTHFKITDITGGALAKNDGTPIPDPTFIKVEEGEKGLKFTPTGDTGGSFKVWASVGDKGDKLSSEAATARIFPLVKPDIAVQPGAKDEPFTVTVKPNAEGAATVTHFKITRITGGALTLEDGTAIPAPPFVPVAQGQAVLKFKPEAGATGGSFDVQSATSANEADVASEPATATVPVKRAGGGK